MEGDIYDVMIIGSGPAGLTAGIYCGRANLKTVVVGGSIWGGQLMLTTDVENFPGFPKGILGPQLMGNMRAQSEKFGGRVVEEDATGVDFSKRPFEVSAGEKKYLGKAVIVATGAAAKWLELPNEQKLIGRGVSSCAPCDAPFFREKDVIVVGGGDAAMEEALTLARFAKTVTIVHRKSEFKASKIMQERVMGEPKIKIIWNTEVADILGESKVGGVTFKSQTPRLRQGYGGQANLKFQINQNFQNSKVVSQNEKEIIWEMAIDGVFVAIGHVPATGIFNGKIELDEKGYVAKATNSSWKGSGEFSRASKFQTSKRYSSMSSVEGVFVSGDVHDYYYRQAITAAGFGCMAAMDAERWLAEQEISEGTV